MRSTTIYRTKRSGEVEKIEVNRKAYSPSYDSEIDKPMHQRVLDNYYKFECEGTLRPTDIIHSKTYMRDVHQQALAEDSR